MLGWRRFAWVLAAPGGRALAILGDSITDGVGSGEGQDHRWTDFLARRLRRERPQDPVAVVNAGISGNRILHDGFPPFMGASAMTRFDRDALDLPGVRWVLLAEGINDINATEMLTEMGQQASASQLIAAMQAMVVRAHARGLAIWGATLLPLGGVGKPFVHSPAGEAMRQAVNAWMRNSRCFDAVLDFDRLLRDPAHPECLRPEYDSGDHLHPNDAGYRAMAFSVDLKLFSPRARKMNPAR